MPAPSDSQNSLPHSLEAVTPVDIVRGHSYPMAMPSQPAAAPEARSSSDTGGSSLKSPRTARFAEATSVQSPVGRTENSESPFADPPIQPENQHDVSDVGFGYVSASDPARHASHFRPPASPLKSALKTPGTPGRALNPLSPTFREEYYMEKQEKVAEKENARDLVSDHQIPMDHAPGAYISILESQAACQSGQNFPPLCELQLQSNCTFPTRNHIDHLPYNKASSHSEWQTGLGSQHEPMASVSSPVAGLCLVACLFDRVLGLLERRP